MAKTWWAAWVISLGVCGLTVSGCTASTHPPGVSSPLLVVNTEACRTATLNLQHLTSSNTRGLVNCLNGESRALEPLKVFLDSMSDADLTVILNFANSHLFKDTQRLNQTLDILDQMHRQGSLKMLLGALHMLSQNGVPSRLWPVMVRFLESENGLGVVDPNVKWVERYLATLIKQNTLGPTIIAAADGFGGLSAQTLALLLAVEAPAHSAEPVLNHDGVVDLFADQVLQMIDDRTLHSLFTHLSDQKVSLARAFNLLSVPERTALTSFLNFLMQAHGSGFFKLDRVQTLIAAAEQPLICYKKGGPASRQTDNLFKMIAREAITKPAGQLTTVFSLQTVPMMIAATRDSCGYDAAVLENLDVFTQVATHGYADGLRAFLKAMLSGERFSELTLGLKSPHLLSFAPVFQELARRDATGSLVNFLAQDISASDSVAVSDDLKLVISAQTGENALNSLLRKTFATEIKRREELKGLAAAVVASLADRRGGVGAAFSALAQGVILTRENPIQTLIAESLVDEAALDELHPVLLRLMKDQKFTAAVNFVGEISGNGTLESLIDFFVNVMRSPALDRGAEHSSSNSLFVYAKPSMTPFEGQSAAQHKVKPAGFEPELPIAKQFSECLKVRGSLYESDGQNLGAFLRCANATGANPELAKIASHLESQGALQDAARLLKESLIASPHITGTLTQLQKLVDTGALRRLLNIFSLAVKPPYNFYKNAAPFLHEFFGGSGSEHFLRWLGRGLQSPAFYPGLDVFLDILNRPAPKSFLGDDHFRLRVRDPSMIRAKIREWYRGASDRDVETLYQEAKENFETHNDHWKYVEGSYPILSDQQLSDSIILFLKDLSRTADLGLLIAALKQIGAHDDPVRFFNEAVDQQLVVFQYGRDGLRHVHIETLLDSLEELNHDSNFIFDVFGPGSVGHVGVNFQLAVNDSANLSRTVFHERSLVELGIHVAELSRDKIAARGFHNMAENFESLQRLARNGDLRIFQRLYRAFYAATEPEYRRRADINLNHMGAFNHLSDLGGLQALTMALAHAKADGELDKIVRAVFKLIELIGPNDVEPLRQLLVALLTPEPSRRPHQLGGTVLLMKFINLQRDLQRNPRAYEDFKDGLLRMGMNISALTPEALSRLRDFASLWLNGDLPWAAAAAIDAYSESLDSSVNLWPLMKRFKNDPAVVAARPYALFKNITHEFQNQAGFADNLGLILLDAARRRELIRLMRALTEQQDLDGLSQVLAREIDSGNVEATLHFVFDNLALSSLQFKGE